MAKVIELRRPARAAGKSKTNRETAGRLTPGQRAYLRRGLNQPGGKLPLFDTSGQRYSRRTIESCLEHGWAEPWFENPIAPDWLICKLTAAGRDALGD
ncbi:MAG: hypothetical protein AAF495_00085 [Pseudomonadota bacterium]